MLDIKDNFTNNSHYGNYTQSDGYGRKDLLVIFYMGVSVRLITSLAIVISASIVLLAIKKSKRTTSLHFFFVANLKLTDIGMAVICNGTAIVNMR